MNRTATALLCLALSAALGQETKKKKVEALPEGQTRVFKAIVMEVRGTAQVRAGKDKKWVALKVNDALDPGALVRTGRGARVALRVGPNASVLVERHSRVAIPEIVQDGQVLRTRVELRFGKADMRVDRVGLENDFQVKTPTATLAVRGTAYRLWWGAIHGNRTLGVPGNKLRVIELAYVNGVKARLSRADRSTEAYELPSLAAFYETYLQPLEGAIGESEKADKEQSQEWRNDPLRQTDIEAARRARGEERRAQEPTTGGTDVAGTG